MTAPEIPKAADLKTEDLPAYYDWLRSRLLRLWEPPLLPGYTHTETAIIRALARAPTGLTPEAISDIIHGDREDGAGGIRSVYVHITRLRGNDMRILRVGGDRRQQGQYRLDPTMKAVVDKLEEAVVLATTDGREAERFKS